MGFVAPPSTQQQLLLLYFSYLTSYIVVAGENNEVGITNNPSKTSSDARKDYYWKLWAKLILGCIALVFACCKCCRQCQKGSDDEDDDDVIKNDKELRIICDLCKDECLNPWHTHDFYCKAIKATTSVGTTFERLNIPISDLKCPKCIHGYLGLRPPDVIPIDPRFKFICDLKEKVPENHVRLMNLVEGNEEKNQFTCMNCMCNLCLRCVRDMKLRNRPLKIVQWFHLGDESRLFDNFRRTGGPSKDHVLLPPPPPGMNMRYGFESAPSSSAPPAHQMHHHHPHPNFPMELPPYLPSAPDGVYSSVGYSSNSPNDGYPNPVLQPPPPPEREESRSSNLLVISDLQRNRQQRMKGLNRSWSIMYPDNYPNPEDDFNNTHSTAHYNGVIPPTSRMKRGPLNRSLSVSTDFVANRSIDVDDDIFNRHPKASKPFNNKQHPPPITRSVSTKKIPHESADLAPLPTSLRPIPRRGTLNRSMTIIEPDEPPPVLKQKRGILNRSASMSTQQLAKASNALENERRAFEATFIKKMDEEELLEDDSGTNRNSYGDLTSEDSRLTTNEDDYQSSIKSMGGPPGMSSSSGGNGVGSALKRGNRPKLRAQFSTDELDVRRVVSQSRNEKRYNNSANNSNNSGNSSSGGGGAERGGYGAINV